MSVLDRNHPVGLAGDTPIGHAKRGGKFYVFREFSMFLKEISGIWL